MSTLNSSVRASMHAHTHSWLRVRITGCGGGLLGTSTSSCVHSVQPSVSILHEGPYGKRILDQSTLRESMRRSQPHNEQVRNCCMNSPTYDLPKINFSNARLACWQMRGQDGDQHISHVDLQTWFHHGKREPQRPLALPQLQLAEGKTSEHGIGAHTSHVVAQLRRHHG